MNVGNKLICEEIIEQLEKDNDELRAQLAAALSEIESLKIELASVKSANVQLRQDTQNRTSD